MEEKQVGAFFPLSFRNTALMSDMSEMSEAASVHSDDEYSYSESYDQNDSEESGNTIATGVTHSVKAKDEVNNGNYKQQTNAIKRQNENDGRKTGNITRFNNEKGKGKTNTNKQQK